MKSFAHLLLRLLPSGFRDRFGREMAEVLHHDHAESSQRGGGSLLSFWWRTLTTLAIAVPREHLADLGMDLRYTCRMLIKRPVFTATATLSLAIGIGAMTTVLAVFDATFGRDIAGVQGQDHLVNVKVSSEFEETFQLTSYPNWEDLRSSGVLEDLAGFSGLQMSFSAPQDGAGDSSEPELRGVQAVTGNYFSVLRVEPRLGRLLSAQDLTSGERVAVISSWLWRERFAEDPAVIGRQIRLNSAPFTVVGVAGEGFRGHFIGFQFDLFVTAAVSGVAELPPLNDRGANWIEMVGRLADGETLEQARAGYELRATGLRSEWPDVNRGLEITLERCSGIDADLRGGLLSFLVILGGVAGFVLLIACVNVANLLLSRMLHRGREISVRMALGAPRSRLARQMMTESLVLALLGGGLGTLIALWATSLVSRSVQARGDIALDVRLDPRALLAAFTVSLLSALFFGLLPAVRASRTQLATFTRGAAQGSTSNRLRGSLVIAQVTLSAVVLVTAGLFLRAFERAAAIDPGFDAENVVQARLDPSLVGMDADAGQALFDELLEQGSSLPGVESASLAGGTPLSLGARFFPRTIEVKIPGVEPPADRDGFSIEHQAVSQGYLDTLRIPLVAGRDFSRGDTEATRGVVLVNETFAERFFESGDALGRTLMVGEREVDIAGVVRDSRYRTLDEDPLPFLYLAFSQAPSGRAALLVRTAPEQEDTPARLRDLIRRLAPELPLGELGSLEDQLAVSLLPQRVAGAVAGALGLIGLFLTAVGLYGVLVYTVNCRSAEIGVRISLGATRHDVIALVLRLGMALAATGLVLGLSMAALLSRALSTFLYGLSPFDPLTYGTIAVLLALTALAAGYLPARRAARIDPIVTLRAD